MAAAENPVGELRLATLGSLEDFEALEPEWDALVRALPRPSPFMLHAWLREWLRHYGDGGDLVLHVARRDGRLVGALPLFKTRRFGVSVVDFFGHFRAAPVDVLLAEGEEEAGPALAERVAAGGADLADMYGLHRSSRLVELLGAGRLMMVERVESPYLDLSAGWEETYRSHTDSKKRNLHKRRRRQLAEQGAVETTIARTRDEVDAALDATFELHERRWEGRPDGSGYATPVGKRFHRAAALALAEQDVVRILTTTLDGRPVAFHYWFVLGDRMFVHRLAFDPALSKFSPGLVNTLDALEAAGAEGLTYVEYLGGGERYKLELSDGFDPLFEGFGIARTARGKAFLRSQLALIEARRRLKRSERVRRFYFESLAPVRRAVHSVRDRARGAA